jgi:hypothetical protein
VQSLAEKLDFDWLAREGGLDPRHIDRLIYLIGSDNDGLGGRKKKNEAPQCRGLMTQTLREGRDHRLRLCGPASNRPPDAPPRPKAEQAEQADRPRAARAVTPWPVVG